MKIFIAALGLMLLSGCATKGSVEMLQSRVNALEAKLAQNEAAVSNTNVSLKQVETEVTKIATIKDEVNELRTENNSAFKSIAEKLSDIKKQLRRYQISRARSAASNG